MSTAVPSRRVVAALAVVLAAVVGLALPAPGGPTAGYPDPPGPPEGGAESGAELGGQFEEANWVPFLGDFELWCTQGNPGYSGCANHHGYPAIDIGMPAGTPVRAAGPGRVLAAGSAGDARGVYVDIRHPDGGRSLYYHLSATRVRSGESVERGQLIGLSGSTGRASAPHLHYEERTATNAQKDAGVMYGVVDGRLLAYPTSQGFDEWNSTPYGTRLVNEAFAVDNTTLYWGGPGVASGDLNGDGHDDTVVGAPGKDVGAALDAGEVQVLYGSPDGTTVTGAERIAQGRDGVVGAPEGNEVSGAAVAVGDLDGDGFDDIALGAPAATVEGARAAGEVVVVYGAAAGLLAAPRSLRLVSAQVEVPGASESGDQFGAALTIGDVDGDGFDDLVVGAPGESHPGAEVAGALTVFNGSETGLLRTGSRELWAGRNGFAGTAEAGDRLGAALGAGDVDGDGVDDVVVGAPGEDGPDGGPVRNDVGALVVLRGRPTTAADPGLRPTGSVELTFDSPDAAGRGTAGDQLGVSAAIGDLDGDGRGEVVAGAVGKDVGTGRDAGAVLVLPGTTTGVTAVGSQVVHSDTAGVPGAAERGDRLGSAVAVGDVNGDGVGDLVVGLAGEDVPVGGRNEVDAGAVLILPGGPSGIEASAGRELDAGSASSGLADQAEERDVLGASVAVGDVDGDDVGDLVVGAPGRDLPAAEGQRRAPDAGAVTMVDGVVGGLLTGPSVVLHGDVPGMPGDGRRGDRWGGLFPIYLH